MSQNQDTSDEWLLPLLMVPIAAAVIALLWGMCYSATKITKGQVLGGIGVYQK